MDHRIRENLKIHWLPLVVLIAMGCVVYGASTGHQFLTNWDDNKYVTANDVVRGFSWPHVKAAFSSFYVGNYAPVQMLSYMLDYELWGMKASGFIGTNIFLHICNTMLFYVLLVPKTGRRIGAFFGAALFLLHPVQVETVDWISQRKNLLSMFFFLLSWIGYVRYRRGDGRASYLLSIIAFVLALLTKSVAVVAPVIFLADDICRCEKKRSAWIIDKLPYLLAAAAVAALALVSQRPELGGGRTGYHGGSLLATLYTMLPVFAEYLRMLFWPAGLSAIYDPPVRHVVDLQVAGAALSLLLLVALCWYLYRRERILAFGMVVFFVGLLPVSQIVPLITLMNDRYLYFPMLGAGIVFGRGAVLAGEFLGARGRLIGCGTLCLLLFFLGYTAQVRTKAWQDAVTLWSDAVRKAPRSTVAWFGLGNALDKAAVADRAEGAYLKALTLDPFHRETLDNLSFLYLSRGQIGKAREILLVTVAKYPEHRDALMNLGTSAYLLGDFAAAEQAFHRAMTLKPSAEVLMLLATANLHLGSEALAADFYRRAQASGQPSVDVLYGMAAYAALQGKQQEAFDILGRAVAGGYRDCTYLERDPDITRLRALPAMQQLRDKVCIDRP